MPADKLAEIPSITDCISSFTGCAEGRMSDDEPETKKVRCLLDEAELVKFYKVFADRSVLGDGIDLDSDEAVIEVAEYDMDTSGHPAFDDWFIEKKNAFIGDEVKTGELKDLRFRVRYKASADISSSVDLPEITLSIRVWVDESMSVISEVTTAVNIWTIEVGMKQGAMYMGYNDYIYFPPAGSGE